ncbi:MAG: DUF421 domain-containing protein [Sphingobium sp.]|uniref:DUF421 domain-containing protein n=1 Tax=Sphingobium sp. TaxID=1912891 RepID=UPI0029BF59E5|nr:YetF domain-containing protein [Sphingobium sp.]MDX3911126.1 DUF421 domain-containing protein [Sphingobium sp.]
MEWLERLTGSQGDVLWWQMCLRSLIIFFFGLLLLRFSGKRVRGRWGAFDIVLFVIIGSNLSRALTGNAPMISTLAATTALVVVHMLLAKAAVYWRPLGPLLKGHSARLAQDCQVDEAAMKRHSVGRGDLDEAVRTAGLKGMHDVAEAWIERNGHISIIRK